VSNYQYMLDEQQKKITELETLLAEKKQELTAI
jgi:hypothetical protein